MCDSITEKVNSAFSIVSFNHRLEESELSKNFSDFLFIFGLGVFKLLLKTETSRFFQQLV